MPLQQRLCCFSAKFWTQKWRNKKKITWLVVVRNDCYKNVQIGSEDLQYFPLLQLHSPFQVVVLDRRVAFSSFMNAKFNPIEYCATAHFLHLTIFIWTVNDNTDIHFCAYTLIDSVTYNFYGHFYGNYQLTLWLNEKHRRQTLWINTNSHNWCLALGDVSIFTLSGMCAICR